MNTILVNGQKIEIPDNSSVIDIQSNGSIVVGGKEVYTAVPGLPKIDISISGDVGLLISHAGNVKVLGDSQKITAHAGNVSVGGDVSGDVSTRQGNIKVGGDIAGNASTTVGKVKSSK